MATKAQLESIKRIVCDWSDTDIISAWNDYADRNKYEHIYSMSEFDEVFGNKSPLEVARACYYGHFNISDEWFEYNGHGNINTFSYMSDSQNYDLDSLVRYMADNGDLGDVEVDRDELLSEFAEIYELTEEEAENIVAASDYDLLEDDWGVIFNEGSKAYKELLAENEDE